jgi:hypothetical protein
MSKPISVIIWVVLVALATQPPAAQAQSASYSPFALVYVGILIVDGGAALANGFALSMDRPDRRNGQFGLVLGTASVLLAGTLYAIDPDHEYSEEAALMLGGAGLAAAVTGRFAIRAANRHSDIIPTVAPHNGGVSVGLRMTF